MSNKRPFLTVSRRWMKVHSIMWCIVVLIAMVVGFVASLSLMGHITLSFAATLFSILATFVLAITLFAAGLEADVSNDGQEPQGDQLEK